MWPAFSSTTRTCLSKCSFRSHCSSGTGLPPRLATIASAWLAFTWLRASLPDRLAPAARRAGPHASGAAHQHFLARGLGRLHQRLAQLLRALACAGQVHAHVHFVVELGVLGAYAFRYLFELFDCHSTAHLSSCSSICSAVTSPATSPSHSTTGARLQAPTQRAVIRLIFPSLVVWPCLIPELLLGRGHQLVGALDVAGRAGADRHRVLARRLQAEVVVERHHAVGLAQRNAQRCAPQTGLPRRPDSQTRTARCAASQSAHDGQSRSCAWYRSRSSIVCRRSGAAEV